MVGSWRLSVSYKEAQLNTDQGTGWLNCPNILNRFPLGFVQNKVDQCTRILYKERSGSTGRPGTSAGWRGGSLHGRPQRLLWRRRVILLFFLISASQGKSFKPQWWFLNIRFEARNIFSLAHGQITLNQRMNEMLPGIKWHDVACHHEKPIICEDEPGHLRSSYKLIIDESST